MRILHLTSSHRWTGAAEPAARLARAEMRLGHEVRFALTPGSSFDREATELGLHVERSIPFYRSLFLHRRWRDKRLLAELLSAFKPDIVHSHLTHDHVLAAVAIGAPRPHRPILVRSWHRESKPRRDPLTTWLGRRRTYGAIAVSRHLAEELEDAYGFPDSRILVSRGTVDCDRFRPTDRGAAMRQRWNIPADAPVVGVISRLRIARGIEWLIDSAEDFLARMPDAWLVVCGRGNWRDAMRERIAAHPHGCRIHHAGYVSGTDLEDAYNAFDVGLLLRPGNDGACRGALEAMACGKPVIAGEIGALHDLIAGTERGWLVADMDRRALADAVVHALSDLDESRRRGVIARADMERTFGETGLASEVVDFYGRLLREMGHPDGG